ncbi:PREDICTED: uncharacterized protein LOC108518806 isoform X2 [Rhinopithecus bieti]|uniref:uncharacterized protein LOC108518806 isoform X2 n=1 Tax=Rhinopithecus bieti TaxID=61621 RepID=UPI00083C16F4|nr:PREDICTED: uncharacterized protein LOC108518806 isoform X2 [Rhinopithecus bieti]
MRRWRGWGAAPQRRRRRRQAPLLTSQDTSRLHARSGARPRGGLERREGSEGWRPQGKRFWRRQPGALQRAGRAQGRSRERKEPPQCRGRLWPENGGKKEKKEEGGGKGGGETKERGGGGQGLRRAAPVDLRKFSTKLRAPGPPRRSPPLRACDPRDVVFC